MRRIITLISIGCISFTGFTAQAQMSGSFGSLADQITSGDSITKIIDDMVKDARTISGPASQQTSAIEEGETLVVEDEVTSEVNKVVAEAIDTKTKRYPPRLKINFSELPLRSLTSTSRRTGETKTQRDIIAQRIQNRLSIPDIELVVKDRTATISGTVSTDRQRKLAANMLRFEPGIDVVQNEIVVVPFLPDFPSENSGK